MITWVTRNLIDYGYRVSFDAEFVDETGAVVSVLDFLIEVPSGAPIVADSVGRYLTESGAWLIPVIEVDEEWQGLPEDPADPWVREHQPRDVPAAVERACAAYATTLGVHRGGS